jgi:hypothetical protein
MLKHKNLPRYPHRGIKKKYLKNYKNALTFLFFFFFLFFLIYKEHILYKKIRKFLFFLPYLFIQNKSYNKTKKKRLSTQSKRVINPINSCTNIADLLPHQYTATNKNNHTTSTKCQYQAAASKPT